MYKQVCFTVLLSTGQICASNKLNWKMYQTQWCQKYISFPAKQQYIHNTQNSTVQFTAVSHTADATAEPGLQGQKNKLL